MILAQIIQTQQRELEFAGRPGGWVLLLSLAVLAAICAGAVWLYRNERRAGASRTLRAFLAGARCIVYGALAFLLLEPVIATYRERTQAARVVVLHDVSTSMDIADASSVGGASRLAEAASLMTEADFRWLRALQQKNDLAIFAFGDGVAQQPVPWSGAVESGRMPLDAPPNLRNRTDLTMSFARVLDDLGDGPIAGLIVISDGAVNRGGDADALVHLAKARRAPIFSVGVGTSDEPPNLRVIDLAAPSTTPLGDPFELKIEVGATGPAVGPAKLELRAVPAAALTSGDESLAAGELIAERDFEFDADGRSQTLTISTQPKAAGEFVYRAVVSGDRGEATAIDNTRDAAVRVLDTQYRVLLVSGRPSYEYRFLARILERDNNIDLSCWLQSADEQAVRDGDAVITELPRKPDDLFAYDVVILLDPHPGELDSAWAAIMRRFVDEFRGGMLLVAGPHYTQRFLKDDRLQDLCAVLPIVPDPDADVRLSNEGTFRPNARPLIVPEDARSSPILSLGADPAANERIWSAMPGVWWNLPVLREKPVASVILRTADSPTAGANASVLLATQVVGGGRTAFLGCDTTWRWRAAAEQHYNRFWVQMVRYLAQGRRESENQRGAIVLDRDAVNLGDYAKIEVRVLDEQFVPWFEPRIDLSIEHAGAASRQVALSAIPDRAGWFGGRVLFDAPGATRLWVQLPVGAPDAKPAKLEKSIRVQQPDYEMRTLRQNVELLREMSTRTGGEYLTLEAARRLPERIADARQTSVTRDPSTESLWDRPWVLALLACLLSIEWITRRRNYLL